MDIPYANTFLNYGVLGVFSILLIIVCYTLFKLLMEEKDKRRDDVDKLNNGLLDPIRQIKENSETQITLLRQFLEKIKP